MPKAIGLLIDWLEEEYQDHILAGVEDAAREHDATLICFVGGTLDALERFRFGKHRNFIYDLAGPACLDGLLISAGTLGNAIGPERLAEFCKRFRPLPMCALSVPIAGFPCVTVDNTTGMRDAVTSFVGERGL